MIGFLIAILSGVLMSLQGVFNTGVTKQTGIWTAGTIVHLSGFLVCLAAYFITERTGLGEVLGVRPKYFLTGGIIGAFITYTVIYSISKMGPSKTAMFIVISQLISAYLIEVFGWFGTQKQEVTCQKVLGMAIAIGGIILFKWK